MRQTIKTSVDASRLRRVLTRNFIDFTRIRKLHEELEQEKYKEPGTQVAPTSIKASMDDADLQIFIATGWVKRQKSANHGRAAGSMSGIKIPMAEKRGEFVHYQQGRGKSGHENADTRCGGTSTVFAPGLSGRIKGRRFLQVGTREAVYCNQHVP